MSTNGPVLQPVHCRREIYPRGRGETEKVAEKACKGQVIKGWLVEGEGDRREVTPGFFYFYMGRSHFSLFLTCTSFDFFKLLFSDYSAPHIG